MDENIKFKHTIEVNLSKFLVTNLTNFNGTYKFNVYRKNTKLPYDGPPKFQNAINEIQSMVIFIFKKERHQTLTKKSHSEKESL